MIDLSREFVLALLLISTSSFLEPILIPNIPKLQETTTELPLAEHGRFDLIVNLVGSQSTTLCRKKSCYT
jgi:hypothetical protein